MALAAAKPSVTTATTAPNVAPINHISSNPTSGPYQQTSLDITQLKYCDKVLKNSKRLKDAAPFLLPVDPVALGIPTYFSVIKQPMDLSTIQGKLSSQKYKYAQEFVEDYELMVRNCYLFNGRDSFVGKMAQKMEAYFHTQMKSMPVAVCVYFFFRKIFVFLIKFLFLYF